MHTKWKVEIETKEDSKEISVALLFPFDIVNQKERKQFLEQYPVNIFLTKREIRRFLGKQNDDSTISHMRNSFDSEVILPFQRAYFSFRVESIAHKTKTETIKILENAPYEKLIHFRGSIARLIFAAIG